MHDSKEIGDYFTMKFQDLYKSKYPSIPLEVGGIGCNYVMEQENEELIRIPAEQEIKDSVDKLHPLKSPEPDGFPGILYRCYWNTVKGQIVRFIQECFRLRKMPYSSNKMFLVLIPKTKQPCSFNDYRHISLCNFAYKILSKILTERLKKFMGRIISPNQGAFVEGRWIAENRIVAHEVVHKIKQHKGKKGLMLIKMDLKKAYDRLEWDCIMKALNA